MSLALRPTRWAALDSRATSYQRAGLSVLYGRIDGNQCVIEVETRSQRYRLHNGVGVGSYGGAALAQPGEFNSEPVTRTVVGVTLGFSRGRDRPGTVFLVDTSVPSDPNFDNV